MDVFHHVTRLASATRAKIRWLVAGINRSRGKRSQGNLFEGSSKPRMADAPWADAPKAPPLEFRPLAPSLPLARPETSECVQWALPSRLFQDPCPAPPLSPYVIPYVHHIINNTVPGWAEKGEV